MSECEAYDALSKIEGRFVEKFKDVDGLTYLAVVKDKCHNFVLELGYIKGSEAENKRKEIKDYIIINSPINIGNVRFPKEYIKKHSKSVKKLKIKEAPLNIDSEKDKDDDQIESDYFIYNDAYDSEGQGTFGGIISISEHKNTYFLITNQHVIKGKVGDQIKNTNKQIIGEFYWGKHDASTNNITTYDIALAKITNPSYYPSPSFPCFDHKKLIQASYKIKKVKGYGAKSGNGEAILLSCKALYKIQNTWFKDQILFTQSKFNGGDSGTIITDIHGNVIGLYHGGDNEIGVVNNLYNLFNFPITDQTGNLITFTNFH